MSKQHTKALGRTVVVKASGTPDADQLNAIRRYTLREFSAAELVVREFALAHNAIDRDGEVFTEGILRDFERTLPGKGVHIRHPGGWDGDTGPGEGKVFAARLQRMSHDEARELLREPDLKWLHDSADAVLLMVDAYYVRTPENESFLLKLDAGIAGEVSIGFYGGNAERATDADGVELNIWQLHAPATAAEMSHVWLGAQPGARATKSASQPEENAMSDAKIKALEAEVTKAQAELADAKAATTTLSAIRKALGADASLLDTPEKLAEQLAAGKAYVKSLLDDIITAERHAGITGDDDAAIKASRALYESMPVEKIKALADRYAALNGGAPQIPGSDPNAGNPGTGKTTTAPEGSPLSNPMIQA